ncbi:AbrB/MazE/SpoVT family DNA-binding domain-containing protein [uncultured Aurantimicrobium sp.]|uniref:AbrB/MazE/SpoVT family DNA-binding domain-containing protein n=1 Tax=uncultured Aurantimicrobium sp. TaxID=1705357 RepID=UPI00263426DF|nr:AbrB/MazE/SpoVT family DNA-binding domain-containing protein [uncultured Aurantimicrobium sp.]
MSIYVNVRDRGQISLPASTRKRFHLDEPGAQVEIIEREGEIVLRPMLPIPADQAWFWTKEWQEGEQTADVEAVAGLGTVYNSGEEFLDSLK